MMQVLSSHGFRDVRRAARHVKFLTAGSTLTGAQDVDRRTRDGFRAVAPALFADLARTPDPDLSLASLTTLAGGQKVLHTFYAQMADPRFRRFLLGICAVSPRFVRGLSQHPLLLETLATDPGAPAGDPALPLPADLMEFKLEQELCAGVRHILGFTDFAQLTGELSAIASRVVAALLAATSRRRSRLPLAVFALGKFGTAELGFDADLDLLFVGGEAGPSGAEALEKTAAGLLNRLSGVMAKGRLYDVDARLRPEGKNAPLVADARAYARYLSSRASLWERQSLTRLRFIAGDPSVGNTITALVASRVYEAPLPAGWSNEITLMRQKMEPRSRTRGSVVLDFKRGAGGMADVEFIVQMIQMKFGGTHPHLRGMATERLLRSAGTPILTGEDRQVLAPAYTMYRRIELLMRIGLEERGSVLPVDEKRDLLARLYDGSSGAALEGRVMTTMKRVRAVFLEIAGRLA
jgi:glutamate-ammonia-ligase adenylyltransferase